MARRVLKQMMQERDMLLGFWQWILDPDITELLGAAGFDYLVMDMEHTARGIESARTCILAANAADIPMIVRVRERDQQFLVEQALEAGAQGVLVPTIETREQCLNVVRFARFPPEGERGAASFVPVTRWLAGTGAELRATANKNVFVSVILETPLAFDNLTDMLSVEGIDAWMPGPGDLSARLGLESSDPRVNSMLEGAFREIAAAGRVGLAWAPDPVGARALGAKMAILGLDYRAISDTRNLLTAAKAALARTT